MNPVQVNMSRSQSRKMASAPESTTLVLSSRPVGGQSSDSAGALLAFFDKTIDELRHLITCQICARPMYEPYTILCGHTFCYSCLDTWFWNHKANKTCPECRACVRDQPAPAYLVITLSKKNHCVQALISPYTGPANDSSLHQPRRTFTCR